MNRSVLILLMGVSVMTAGAEPLKIIGFETESGITFEGATVSNYYTLEFAASPSGPWTNWGSVTEQSITGTVMSAPSPFFYRIKQTDSSAFPPYAVVGHTHSNITSSWLASNAVQTGHIADGAVSEAKLAVSGALVANLNADLLDGLDASAFERASTGRSYLVFNTTGGVAVWDSTTGSWIDHTIGGTIFRADESAGNFAVMNGTGTVAVWNSTTKTWTNHNVGGTSHDLDGSQGNFSVANETGAVAVWDGTTATWTDYNLGGTMYDSDETEGSFGFMNTSGEVAVWDSGAKVWTNYSLGGTSQRLRDCNGTFAAINTAGKAVVWDNVTGTWIGHDVGGTGNDIVSPNDDEWPDD